MKKDNNKSGNNEGSSSGTPPCPKNQTIWQKASSLRQSLRYSSRAKVVQKTGFEFTNFASSEKAATLGAPSFAENYQENEVRRDWRAQKSLSRERRSLSTKNSTSNELEVTKRSLHSRSLCIEWDVDTGGNEYQDEQQSEYPFKHPRSPRKLTKDSGYETSAQCDPDYANSMSDWFSEEKALDHVGDEKCWNEDIYLRNARSNINGDTRLQWNTRNRPLSFSHQEVAVERAKNHRQLRHSYSQREVSHHLRQKSNDSLDNSLDNKAHLTASGKTINNWSNNTEATKSTPSLSQSQKSQHLSTSSTGSLLQSETDEASGNSMVTRRFKKASIYDTLASTSGLDFSPVVQLKAYNKRDNSCEGSEKSTDKQWVNSKYMQNSPSKNADSIFYQDKDNKESEVKSSDSLKKTFSQENTFPTGSTADAKDSAKSIAAHEKYPSWPVTPSSTTSSVISCRSHSWTGQTDYPKEKLVYTRPKKANQFKISTNHLQPVLERASDCNSNVSSVESYCSEKNNGADNCSITYASCNSSNDCNVKEFDFEAFHTPCIPQCYEGKEYKIHSPPERDISMPSRSRRSRESNGFLSRYENVSHHQAQYSIPLTPSWSKERSMDAKEMPTEGDTPFLDRLRLENAWQMPPPPVPMMPAVAVPQQPQQLQQVANDYELSSENGTWMGSMESSSHGRGVAKWQGSYSDLSTLSTQLSNRSSLFDSGHSTMPESGRLSPQSSCDSTAPSLLLEGPTRAQVVARHGCHREIVAHSARVQQPERYGSESILYYATGSNSRLNCEYKEISKKMDTSASASKEPPVETIFRSQATVMLSPPLLKPNIPEVLECQSKTNKCPSRQDSRKSSNSFSSEDSFPLAQSHCGEDTSGSSSDISNITCISNYNDTTKIKSLDETSKLHSDITKPKNCDQCLSNCKSGYDEPKSKSMNETTRKFIFPNPDKTLRVPDPELKAIQKQAVMSFYQRMSLAESMKAEQKSQKQLENDLPPPYEATPNLRKNMFSSKFSLPPKKFNKLLEPSNNQSFSQAHSSVSKPFDSGLFNHHSKSVPNLVTLKGQNLDLPPSHPVFKRIQKVSQWDIGNNKIEQAHKKRGSPLEKDEIISWDQLPNVLEKKREAREKAALASESKDPPEDSRGCASLQTSEAYQEVKTVNKNCHLNYRNLTIAKEMQDVVNVIYKCPTKRFFEISLYFIYRIYLNFYGPSIMSETFIICSLL